MATQHQFGGNWTEEKLERLAKFLTAYTTIFHSNSRAAQLRTTFVDAFAGTGYRNSNSAPKNLVPSMFSEDLDLDDADAVSFQKGSAQIALEVSPGFDRYVFIEKRPDFAQELERLREEYPICHSSAVSGSSATSVKQDLLKVDILPAIVL